MKNAYQVFECDYHERSRKIGEYNTANKAKEAAREAFKQSHSEFPTFVIEYKDGCKRCIADYR